jgi:hypothetical protein
MLRSALVLALAVFSVAPEPADPRIDPAALRLNLADASPRLYVPFENPGPARETAFRVEILAPDDTVLATAQKRLTIGSGHTEHQIDLPERLGTLEGTPQSTVLLYRLRYEAETSGDGARGIASVSALCKGSFRLEAAAITAGTTTGVVLVEVVTTMASAGAPAAGVALTGWVEKARPVEAVSDDLGRATLRIPISASSRSHTVRVTGKRFGLTESAELTLWSGSDLRAIVTADKPLYRPGETIRARGLVVRGGRGVLAARDVQFKVRDDDWKVVFKTTARTSRLGVATFSWSIPERASTGEYSILLGLDDDDADADDAEEVGELAVRVALYELPQFTVEARAEKSVYGLKGHGAVLVNVVTFAGAPVTGAHVEVEGDDTPDAEGRTDVRGRARISIDLGKVQEDVADRKRWRPFEDVALTVRVTDPMSRRTEQRRLELRVTRDALHVYLTPEGDPTSRLPFGGFVTVTSADGSPVEADVVASGELTGRARTNRYGVARLEGAWRPQHTGKAESSLRLEARTADGRRGFVDEGFWYGSRDDDPELKLERERTLLHPGEPLRVRVSSDPPGPVRIVVFSGPELLETQEVAAGREPLRVEFPADGRFSGVLDVIAFRPGAELQTGGRVLYPAADGLRARLEVTPAVARPGSAATARVGLQDALGRPVAGVVGLTGVDQALLDRVQTDDPYANLDPPSLEDNSEALGNETVAGLKALAPGADWDDSLDLAAAFLLRDRQAYVRSFEGDDPDFSRAFRASFQQTADALRGLLAPIQWPDPGYPTLAAVEGALRERETRPPLDPWGRPFVLAVRAAGHSQQLTIQSSGPGDGRTKRLDPVVVQSWSAYVRLENRLRRALAARFARTHRAAASIDDLASELKAENVEPAAVVDLEGRAVRLRAGFLGRNAFVVGERDLSRGDVAAVFTATIDLFAPTAARLEPALSAWVAEQKGLPRNTKEYTTAIRAAGLRPEDVRDLEDREVVVSFGEETRYSDRAQAASGNAAGSTTLAIQAITETSQVLTVWTPRSDPGKASSERLLSRFRYAKGRFGSDREPGQGRHDEVVVSDTTGGLVGRVTDSAGSPLPGATIVVSTTAGEQLFTSDAQGDYGVSGLTPGSYKVQFQMPSFTTVEVDPVVVTAGRVLVLDAQLSVGALDEAITVAAEAGPVKAVSAATSVADKPGPHRLAVTPRLREYFPEALLWQPELEIGPDGIANASFTLADTLTTWHLTAVASTEDGRLATAAVDVVAAQPFYAELDPPQRLTNGDRIDLPVRVRNELESTRDVAVSLTSEGGLSVAAGARSVRVAPNETRTAVFEVRATTPGPEARLTASAMAEDEGDRLARRLSVRPDGEEHVVTHVAAFEASRSLAFEIPAEAVAGSTWAEVSIAPDLRALIAQAIEGSLQRPYGCAEQTVSSAFPGLLLLELHGERPPTALTERARRYLEVAVERLLSQRSPRGGIGYWSMGDPDVAVSAYALRFVRRTRQFVPVPEALVTGLRDFLMASQVEGRWKDAALTAYVARALSELADAERLPAEASLEQARKWLASTAAVSQDPYALAGYALVLDRTTDVEVRAAVLTRLRQLEKRDARGVYWAMERNTCFFGWGRAGRLETTGLVLQALQRAARPEDDERRVAALLYLLDQQDEFGVWWSSQATVSVLEALAALVPREPEGAPPAAIRVALDGVERKVVDVGGGFDVPVVVALGRDLAPGRHVVTLEGAGPRASLRVVTGYATSWTQASGPRTSASGVLRYTVTPSRLKAKAGDNVTMVVEVDRAGFRGYGMMIAEIGLPPGAEVDRAALDGLRWSSGLWHYDVEPDRVVLYLWPSKPVSRYSVTFRPRLAMDALSAPSRLYDYYNPDEEVRLPPHRFEVR